MLATRQIPSTDWATFFDTFSKENTGRMASVQLLGRGSGDHTKVDTLEFAGIAYETKGSEAGSVRVLLGTEANDSISHEIPHLAYVWTRPGETAGSTMLEIKGRNDETLILNLHTN